MIEMEWLTFVFGFVIGTLAGSWLTVIIYRIAAKKLQKKLTAGMDKAIEEVLEKGEK